MLICMLFALTACTYGKIDLGDGKYSQAAAIKGQGGSYKVGNPYKIMGTWYYPKEDYGYSEVGMASWYGEDFHAKKTANGENYDMNTLTAAHRTLPLPSISKTDVRWFYVSMTADPMPKTVLSTSPNAVRSCLVSKRREPPR